MRASLALAFLLVVAPACGKAEPRAVKRAFVTTRDSRVLLPSSLRSVIAGVPGVDSVVPEVPVQWEDGDVLVWGLAADADELVRKQPTVLGLSEEDGARWLRDPEGLVVSRALATRKGWSLGDSVGLNLTTRSAERAAAAEVDRFVVRGIYDSGGEQFAIHLAHYRRIAGLTDDSVPLFVLAISGNAKSTLDELTRTVEAKAPHARVEMPSTDPVPAPGSPQ